MQWSQLSRIALLLAGLWVQPAMAQEKSPGTEPSLPENPEQVQEAANAEKENKWYVVNQLALLLGRNAGETERTMLFSPSLQFSGGYAFRNWLQTGVGTGYNVYENIAVIPFFAELRGLTNNKGATHLYYAVKAGSSYASFQDALVNNTARGGLMTELQTGLSIRGGNWSWLFGGGYHTQRVNIEGELPNWWGAPTWFKEQRTYRRFFISSAFRLTF